MPWIPITTIASSAGASADIYKSKPMKSNKIVWLVVFLLSALLVTYLLKGSTVYPAIYNPDIALRETLSKTVIPKWNTEKSFIITHTHGSSTNFNVVKFECCGTGGMVKDGQLYMGYLNTVEATPIGTTTKTQIPIIDIEILGHELVHLTTLQPYVLEKCPALASHDLQEKIAYNWGHLYSQIRSFEEDNWIRLQK